GRGSYGLVKKVFNTLDGKSYAMKIMSRQRLAATRGAVGGGVGFGRRDRDQDKAAALAAGLDIVRREVAIMKKLDHPNIVRLVEVMCDAESDLIMLVMEFAEGGPLQHVDLDDAEVEVSPGEY